MQQATEKQVELAATVEHTRREAHKGEGGAGAVLARALVKVERRPPGGGPGSQRLNNPYLRALPGDPLPSSLQLSLPPRRRRRPSCVLTES